jgi:hypothetical protein
MAEQEDNQPQVYTFSIGSNGYYVCSEPNKQEGQYVKLTDYQALKTENEQLTAIDACYNAAYEAVPAYVEGDSLAECFRGMDRRIQELKAPVDMLLFCPQCGEQHVDEANPGVCEICGGEKDDFPRNEGSLICACGNFTEWLNPPHKSHRCNFCNHVWRPADVPTNGVLTTKTKGERDGNPRPRYFATAKDFEDAVADIAGGKS